MGFLRGLFGPSKAEMWQQLAAEIGGEFVEGGFWKGDKVQARVGEWTVTLDSYTESSGDHHQSYTRLRAPYVNKDGFRFSIHREGLFSGIGRWFGSQDVQIGDAEFDAAFVIQGNNESQLRRLFADVEVRGFLHAQPGVHFMVRDDEGWFGAQFPEGVDELYFRASGIVRDVERLKNLYALFAAVLDRLCAIGSAYETPPGVDLG